MKNGGRADDVYWKRLPDLVGDVLAAWIACSGRELGQASAPLLIPTRISEPGDPGARYADGSSLSKFVSGLGKRRRPIIPLPGEEWRGYSPHRFRHTITQVVERRADARDTVLLLEAEIAMMRGQVSQLEAKHADLSRRARSARGDAKLHALLDLHSIDREIQAKLRREVELVSKLAEARSALDRAKTTAVLLPNDLDGEEYERKLAEALAEPAPREPASEHGTEAPLADELLVVDLAELFGVSEMTVRRWRAGTSNSPIDPEGWIKVNAKDWRYPVSAIDDRALRRIPADNPQAALDAIRQKRAALGFGRGGQKLKAPSTAA
jgi:hypothetical protein